MKLIYPSGTTQMGLIAFIPESVLFVVVYEVLQLPLLVLSDVLNFKDELVYSLPAIALSPSPYPSLGDS